MGVIYVIYSVFTKIKWMKKKKEHGGGRTVKESVHAI